MDAVSENGGVTAAARQTNVVPIRPTPDLNAAYRATISVHYPNSDELTLATRVDLMSLRDRATAALNRCRPEAEAILMEAARIAGLACLSAAPARSLAFTRVAVESMIFAAQMMQRATA